MRSILAAVGLTLALVALVLASSHSEAPGSSKRLQADLTDFYMFRSYEAGRENFITFIMNVLPLQNPFAGPNYAAYSDAHFYEINIDNDNDATEDFIIQFYYGSQLGGTTNVTVEEFEPCTLASTGTKEVPAGIQLDINGNMVGIPLKVVGAVSAADQSNVNFFEWVQMRTIQGDRSSSTMFQATNSNGGTRFAKPLDYMGEKTFSNYAAYANSFIHNVQLNLPTCSTQAKLFVGPRRESFAVNLGRIFDLVNFNPTTIADCDTNNDLLNLNVGTFALEIDPECLGLTLSDTFAAWLTVRELQHVGGQHVPGRQVSRLSAPLVNEVVIGIRDKDKFNRAHPSDDATNFATYVFYPTLPELLNILFSAAFGGIRLAPTYFPRGDLVAAFLTGLQGLNNPGGAIYEAMRLNLAIAPTARASQSNLGALGGDLAGFPNGRRPGDDVVDIALRVVMGVLCTTPFNSTFAVPSFNIGNCGIADVPTGSVAFRDGAPQNAMQFGTAFPYLNLPLPGATNTNNVCP